MIRILLFVIAVIAAGLGLAWFADRPGSVTIEWLGYQIETSAFFGALAVLAVVVLLILIWSLLRFAMTRPAALAAHFHARRRRQGLDALSKGLLAIGVGDRLLAQKYSNIARRTLPHEPLTKLLRAQAAQLKGDRGAARRAFEDMLEGPETELVGLRGLFLEAKRRNDNDAARALVEQAVKRDPKLAWGVNALLDLQARAGDWTGALNTLAIVRQQGHLDANAAQRKRAVLLTAEARDLEATSPERALALVTEALRLAPSLVPAAEIAGRILASKGESRLASRVVARTWKLAPHPDLALVCAFAKPGEPPRERLKRVKHLASLTPGDREGQIAVAVAAMEAHDWQEARAALAPYLDDRPSARICALMARIEASEFGDKGRERQWLAKGLRAPRDRGWIADGYVSDRWLPVSPVTGSVDAFEWKAPVDAIGRGDETILIEEQIEPVAPIPPAIVAEEQPPPRPAPRIAPLPSEPPPIRVVEIEQPPVAKVQTRETPPAQAEAGKPAEKPQIFTSPHPPDDPGVAQADMEEAPSSLERFRAAHIR